MYYIWWLDTKSTESAKFNTPKTSSHLFYSNHMIDKSIIYD